MGWAGRLGLLGVGGHNGTGQLGAGQGRAGQGRGQRVSGQRAGGRKTRINMTPRPPATTQRHPQSSQTHQFQLPSTIPIPLPSISFQGASGRIASHRMHACMHACGRACMQMRAGHGHLHRPPVCSPPLGLRFFSLHALRIDPEREQEEEEEKEEIATRLNGVMQLVGGA